LCLFATVISIALTLPPSRPIGRHRRPRCDGDSAAGKQSQRRASYWESQSPIPMGHCKARLR